MSVLFLLCAVSLNGTIDESHLNKTQSNPKFAIYFGKKAFEGIRGSTQKSLNLFWLSEWEVRRQDHISHPMRGERAEAKGCSWEFSGFGGTPPHCKQAAQHLSLCKPAGSAKADRCARNQALQQCVTWGERREYTDLCCKCAGYRSKLKNMNSLGLR